MDNINTTYPTCSSSVENILKLEKNPLDFSSNDQINSQSSMNDYLTLPPSSTSNLLTSSSYVVPEPIDQLISISNNDNYSNSNNNNNNNQISNYKRYQDDYRTIVNDMTSDIIELINQVQNQFNICNSDNVNYMQDEKHLNELNSQNRYLEDNLKLLQLQINQNEIAFNQILELKEEQLKNRIKSLEQEVEHSNSQYNALNRKHQALLYDVKQYQEKCVCGAVKAIEVDATDKDALTAAAGRKGPDLQHIFEMMERKDDELKVLKEYSANEKARLNKRITDADEQIKDYEVQIARLKTNMEKKDTELKDLRRKFAEKNNDTQLKDIIEKLNFELSDEKSQRKQCETTLEAKVKFLEAALEETRTALVKANDSLATLQSQSANYQRQGEAVIKENAVLREELFTLKGDIATLEGTERSLKSQLSKTQDEVNILRTANVKIKTLTEDVDNFKQNCVRLKQTNFELVEKYNSLIEDYNFLTEEFFKLSELKDVIEKELEIFRKWQAEQTEQDRITKAHIQHLMEHIETLSEDRDELIQKIYDYHQDLLITTSELDHYKEILADTMSEAHDKASLAAGEVPGQDSADAIIRKILRTAEKLSHTRKSFQESLDRRNSK